MKGYGPQAEGRAFEKRVESAAGRDGLLLTRHGTQQRYLRGGRTISVASDLDYRAAATDGKLVFFDAKSFAGDRCSSSFLPSRQRALIASYVSHSLLAGFLVEFRKVGEVVFFGAAAIDGCVPGTSLMTKDGLLLGHSAAFSLLPLFSA